MASGDYLGGLSSFFRDHFNQERFRTRRRIPAALEHVQTRVIVTGPFVAF